MRDSISKEVFLFSPEGKGKQPCLGLITNQDQDQFCLESLRIKGFKYPEMEKSVLMQHAVSYMIQQGDRRQSNDLVSSTKSPQQIPESRATTQSDLSSNNGPQASNQPIDEVDEGSDSGLTAMELNLNCVSDIAYGVLLHQNMQEDQGWGMMVPDEAVDRMARDIKLILQLGYDLPPLCEKPVIGMFMQLDFESLDLEKLKRLNSKLGLSDMVLSPQNKYPSFDVEGAYNFHWIQREYAKIPGVIYVTQDIVRDIAAPPLTYDKNREVYRFEQAAPSDCHVDCEPGKVLEFKVDDGKAKAILLPDSELSKH